MLSGGGAASSHDEGSSSYTSPIVSRHHKLWDGTTIFHVKGLRQEQRQQKQQQEENTVSPSWLPPKLMNAASMSPSPSPTKARLSFAPMQRNGLGRSPLFSPRKAPLSFATSAATTTTTTTTATAAAVVAASAAAPLSLNGHQYNVPVAVDVPLQQQMLDAFKRRATRAVSLDKLDTMRDEDPLWPSGATRSSDITAARRKDHGGTAVPGSMARDQVVRVVDVVLSTGVSSSVKTGYAGSASNDETIACTALARALEAELHGRFIVEQAELWMREDAARRKACLREEHMRRLLVMRAVAAMHAWHSEHRHAARMRDLQVRSDELAGEERETLLASVRRLESEESVLLERVGDAERRVKWGQRLLALREQEALTQIKAERHAMVAQLQLLETRLAEALERRKRAVLGAAFGHEPHHQLLSFEPHSTGWDAPSICVSRDRTSNATQEEQALTAAKTHAAPLRRTAVSSSMDFSTPTAPLSSSGGGAFLVAMRDATAAATRLLDEERPHPFHHRVVDAPPADYYAAARQGRVSGDVDIRRASSPRTVL
ncbi:hypothetical protein DQ04_02171080 [Trypanosoma grayi]|uniref:hypothetical protein n=1 Tax=Trypanosoma grayi TaxID=71804 RepID=UPI0004F418A8|nr:hypothetical protein DQ04_02171080 [Trypanosoma grayi]KEG11901.1 hypothetical protein DQ04_02171080 [Trypanosoma grayi]